MPSAVHASPSKPQAEFSERATVSTRQRWYFYFFCLSGFCSTLYELIWLRLAMAQFGVTTPMVSIVLSTFMAGLGIGSWAAGHLVRKYATRLVTPPLHLYAAAEILIGCSAVIVPLELQAGRFVLEHLGNSLSLSSSAYYVAAGIWIAGTLIPWCSCMGATIPLGMFAIRSEERSGSQVSSVQSSFSRQSFSFLYLANVLGAVAGTVVPLFFIELWGFIRTLQVGMLLNVAICAGALRLVSRNVQEQKKVDDDSEQGSGNASSFALRGMFASGTLWLLFATGLTSMGMEVVWTRLYTAYVGTLVYSFAMILGVYLAATFVGSKLYRWWSQRHGDDRSLIWLFVWLAALIPLLTADGRIGISPALRVPLGIAAFSCLLGFLTPKLVDRFSEGDPDRAGIAYGVNVAGCILGPLVAGFGLLPHVDERYALVVLATPWLIIGAWFALFRQSGTTKNTVRLAIANVTLVAIVLLASFLLISRTQSYVQQIPGAQVRRDNTATVIAAGQGMHKELYVNGVSMTYLTPITKMMSALPLASLDHDPTSALVICFGMGTTHRSMLSWGIDSTAVDLVPSVPALFWYYHADASLLLQLPNSHVVIDDGRRFLERTTAQYDVIVIDPPPPIGAAGSSLLYSREFYSAAQKRLRPDGILMQWYPGGDHATTAAITRALRESFHYVRAFGSFEGWGVHYLASQQPLPNRSAAELADRLPPNAAADLVEWGPFSTAEQQFAAVLKNEIPIDMLIGLDKDAPALLDDRPVNEYGLLRHIHFSRH
jgi:spermidine synthase